MISRLWLVRVALFGAQVLGGVAAASPAPAPADEARVARLILDLAHDRFETRESAGRMLVESGEKAVPALLRALSEPDAELRVRVREVLERIYAAAGRREFKASRARYRATVVGADETAAKPEAAVEAGLRWLARHQDRDGHWDLDGFQERCGKDTDECCGGPGTETFVERRGRGCSYDGFARGRYDAGLTGLSLLAFLSAGHGGRPGAAERDPHAETVRRGLSWLVDHQSAEGLIGGNEDMKHLYSHAIATMALVEAFEMTGSPALERPAKRALEFLLAAQNPGAAWRYAAKSGESDTSVTGWCLLALESAERAGLDVPASAYAGVTSWLDEVTGEDYRVGYNAKGTGQLTIPGMNEAFAHHETMTAVGILGRLATGAWADPRVAGGAELIERDPPGGEAGEADFCYWHFGALALFHLDGSDGPRWKQWSGKLREKLVARQSRGGCADGSWDPADRWGFKGGRVYATAMNVLALETAYRYPRFGGDIQRLRALAAIPDAETR